MGGSMGRVGYPVVDVDDSFVVVVDVVVEVALVVVVVSVVVAFIIFVAVVAPVVSFVNGNQCLLSLLTPLPVAGGFSAPVSFHVGAAFVVVVVVEVVVVMVVVEVVVVVVDVEVAFVVVVDVVVLVVEGPDEVVVSGAAGNGPSAIPGSLLQHVRASHPSSGQRMCAESVAR